MIRVVGSFWHLQTNPLDKTNVLAYTPDHLYTVKTLLSTTPSIDQIEAVKFPNWVYPGNWDRVCGYLGTAPFVAFHTKETSLIWTDGHLHGSSTSTYPFFLDAVLYNKQKVGQAVAALGCENPFPFGKPTTATSPAQTAVFCLLIDRSNYSAWVAPIQAAKVFMQQVPTAPLIQLPVFPPTMLTQPCFNCTHGWVLS
jgi:hypothetical protein